ncbi:hypothetical protein AB835_11230 [Candidatus Endobugula sertula]|uniref:Uncharacterized protein n=1 Tax=Candidatus Endobugula sertula TaxID=62101 RepID=A0A1D2QN15_9GAMM|nr:hypothetical protein AB835_11230 [Candidatus Endobugula sertula]
MVYADPQPGIELKGMWVRILLLPRHYIDTTTGEVVVSYSKLRAKGGVVFKGFSQGGVPLTFYGSCQPKENVRDLFKSLQITILDR